MNVSVSPAKSLKNTMRSCSWDQRLVSGVCINHSPTWPWSITRRVTVCAEGTREGKRPGGPFAELRGAAADADGELRLAWSPSITSLVCFKDLRLQDLQRVLKEEIPQELGVAQQLFGPKDRRQALQSWEKKRSCGSLASYPVTRLALRSLAAFCIPAVVIGLRSVSGEGRVHVNGRTPASLPFRDCTAPRSGPHTCKPELSVFWKLGFSKGTMLLWITGVCCW